MAQFKRQRGGRPQKRHRPSNGLPEPHVSSQTQEGAVAEVHDDQDVPELSDIESDEEPTIRPFNQLLDLFNVDPERQGRKPKRRKIQKGVASIAAAASGPSDEDSADSEQELDSIAENNSEAIDEADEQDEVDSVADVEADYQEDNDDSGEDPFLARIDAPDQSTIVSRIRTLQAQGWQNHKESVKGIGGCTMYSPKDTQLQNQLVESRRSAISSASMKKKLEEPALRLDQQLSMTTKPLAPYILGYSDVLYGARSAHNAADLRQMACLHALNHVFKTRDRVLKHNNKLAASKEESDSAFRDQGFTRPKVLFMLPTRGACVKVVDALIKMSQTEQQENKKRFEDSFSNEGEAVASDRPDDFKDLFDGNNDDMFRIGIKFTRKTMKFFTPFYSSDMILASPLGLRNAIDGGHGKKADYDFLSSIEIVVIDQADALLMQNWEHVTYVMQHLNLSPKESHGCDFSRVRMWYLDDQAKYLRQTICLSSFITPEINALFNKYMLNVFGKMKYQPTSDGAMLTTGLPIKQTFARYPSTNIRSDPDTRFNFFTSTIIPWMLRQPRPAEGGLGILIFVPSYFDFIRIKNYFTTSPTVTSLSFATVTENHTSAEPETRRARSHFLTGKSSVLIYTGRAHHFYRYMIKGVKHVVMYQLPDNPLFYREIVAGFLNASVVTGRIAAEEGSARVLFSKWDALRLERIVGTDRLRTMMGAGDTFDFI